MTTPYTGKRYSDGLSGLFTTSQAERDSLLPRTSPGFNPVQQVKETLENKGRTTVFEQPFLVERSRVYEDGGPDL